MKPIHQAMRTTMAVQESNPNYSDEFWSLAIPDNHLERAHCNNHPSEYIDYHHFRTFTRAARGGHNLQSLLAATA